jgi:hypothetical protein
MGSRIMIPFNLEKAIAGNPVQTENGKPVHQLTVFDCDERYNVVGIVDNELCRWDREGSNAGFYTENLNLVMTPIKKTGFVNLYKDNKGNIITAAEKVSYDSSWVKTVADALMREKEVGKYIATVEVEWEE